MRGSRQRRGLGGEALASEALASEALASEAPVVGLRGRAAIGRAEGYAGSRSEAEMRERSCKTALVWIWQTRLSVMPRIWPIWLSVRFS